MSKTNVKSIPLLTIINGIPKDMPFELIIEITNWDLIIKSPYGYSYYNQPVGWDFKTPDSLRIADHWNFFYTWQNTLPNNSTSRK